MVEIPTALKKTINQLKVIIQTDPEHEMRPINRRKIRNQIVDYNDKVWRWLSILTAEYVLPLYREPEYPDHIRKKREGRSKQEQQELYEAIRYSLPEEALKLARRVMHGKFDSERAWHIAGDMHYVENPYLSVKSLLVQSAANKALVAVSGDDCDGFGPYDDFSIFDLYEPSEVPKSLQSDLKWGTSGQSDTAAAAAIAWSCIVNPSPEEMYTHGWIEWNWWIQHERIDKKKLLEFWSWWLEKGIPNAFRIVHT